MMEQGLSEEGLSRSRSRHRLLTIVRNVLPGLIYLLWIFLLKGVVTGDIWIWTAVAATFVLYMIQRRRKELLYSLTDRLDYKFRIWASSQHGNKRRKAITIISIIVAAVIFSIPFLAENITSTSGADEELRFGLTLGYSIFLLVTGYLYYSDMDYNYFLFLDKAIVRPGFPSRVIPWAEVKTFTEAKKYGEIHLILKNGRRIRLDLQETPALPVDKVIAFVRARVQEPEGGDGGALCKKFLHRFLHSGAGKRTCVGKEWMLVHHYEYL
jgi:hypothetical protein